MLFVWYRVSLDVQVPNLNRHIVDAGNFPADVHAADREVTHVRGLFEIAALSC